MKYDEKRVVKVAIVGASKLRKSVSINFVHLISGLIILSSSFLLFYRNLSEPGMLIYVDMTWPLSLQRTLETFSYEWFPYGGYTNLANSYRRAWVIIPLFLCYKLGFSINFYLQTIFIGTFFLAGLSMYTLTYFILENTNKIKNRFAIAICCVISATVYQYNPWSLGHLWTYFLYPTYALLPVILLCLIKYFQNPKTSMLFLIVALMTIASTSPSGIIWIFVLLFSFVIFTTLLNYRRIVRILKFLIIGGALWLCFNMYWILSYIQSTLKTFVGPVYTFSPQLLDFLSRNNAFLNGFRLVSGWGYPISPIYTNTLWIFVSFVFPLFAFFALLKYEENQILIYLALLSIMALFMSTGVNSPIPQVYRWLSFEAPWSGTLGWVLRAPDRWLALVSLPFSVLFGLSIFHFSSVFLKTGLSKLLKVFVLFSVSIIVIATLFSFYPTAEYYSNNVFNPEQIPEDYEEVNAWLAHQDSNSRVLWLPMYRPGGYYPVWTDKRIGAINIWSCDKKSINTFNWLFDQDSLLYWLENVIKQNKTIPVGRLITPLGIKYLIIDTSIKGSNGIISSLNMSTDLQLVFNTNYLYVYENVNPVRTVHIPRIVVLAHNKDEIMILNLESQRFSSEATIIFDSEKEQFGIEITASDDLFDSLIENDSYEAGWNFTSNSPVSWSSLQGGRNFTITLDTETSWAGNQSLKLETNCSEVHNIGWVKGTTLQVSPGEFYIISSHMKWLNSIWPHVVVYGYDNETRQWKQILHCPSIQSGTSEWKEWTSVFQIPDNITQIAPYLAAGWRQNVTLGKGITWFDDIKISRVNNARIEDLLERENNDSIIVLYQEIDPTKYTVRINATQPFMLSFAEAYNPLWVAHVNGEKINSIPLYSVINGFWVNQTGQLTITIEYEPQRWFYMGSAISVTTLIACAIYLTHDWMKNKDILKRVRKWSRSNSS